MSSNNKRKKTALKVIGIILLIIVVVIGVFAFKYRSHIKAAVIWLTTSDEDIQKNIEAAKNQQTEVLNDSGFYANAEADEALASGEITAEQHTQILLGSLTLDEIRKQNSENTQNETSQNTETADEPQTEDEVDKNEYQDTGSVNDTEDVGKTDSVVSENKMPSVPESVDEERAESPPVSNKPVESDKESGSQTELQNQPADNTSNVDKRIAELVTKMYVLKSEYTGAVEGVVSSMKAEFVQLPPEQRTKSAKQSIAANYMSKINAMEVQCDAQVNAIVSELKKILEENGRDMSLVDAILSSYATEKENTKAYYLSTYGD